jgi:hypothetical protein
MFAVGNAVLFMTDAFGQPYSTWHRDAGGFHPRWKHFGKGVIVRNDEVHSDAYLVEYIVEEKYYQVWFKANQLNEDDSSCWAVENEAYSPSRHAYGPCMGAAPVAIWQRLKVAPVDGSSPAASFQRNEVLNSLNTLLRRKLQAWPYGFSAVPGWKDDVVALLWQRV